MKVVRISDWDLEDRLSIDPRPIVAMFIMTGEIGQDLAREQLKHMAASYADARFYEIDLLENPSLIEKFGLKKPTAELRVPVTLVFVRGTEQARLFGSQLAGAMERILGPHPDRRG